MYLHDPRQYMVSPLIDRSVEEVRLSACGQPGEGVAGVGEGGADEYSPTTRMKDAIDHWLGEEQVEFRKDSSCSGQMATLRVVVQ